MLFRTFYINLKKLQKKKSLDKSVTFALRKKKEIVKTVLKNLFLDCNREYRIFK